jgi:Domain of unknown function (DUF1998)
MPDTDLATGGRIMSKPGTAPIRRAQLVAPFGVGAMNINRDGISMITAGLDDWFSRDTGQSGLGAGIDKEEFKVHEWRLQRLLGVDHFLKPPDHRDRLQFSEKPLNTDVRIPAWRFPRWHWCPRCKRLEQTNPHQRDAHHCVECNYSSTKAQKVEMVQVRFVAMCEQGHIQDFPWREWVHRDANPSCLGTMRLSGTGGLGLESQLVKCSCGKNRSLAGITNSNFLSTALTSNGEEFFCRGQRPWLGDVASEICTAPLRGALRNATNVYFADVRSALYLPRGGPVAPEHLVDLLTQPPLSSTLNLFKSIGQPPTPSIMRQTQYNDVFASYSDEQVSAALRVALGEMNNLESTVVPESDTDAENELRRDEYTALRSDHKPDPDSELHIQHMTPKNYNSKLFPQITHFQRIGKVTRLRETRVLVGFSRIIGESGRDRYQQQELLWRNRPDNSQAWLPANVVHGEGIYLELDETRLQKWEIQPSVQTRSQALHDRYSKVQTSRGLRERKITPRFLLVHTLAHLLINQLTFDCGYSSASLRERLYIAGIDQSEPMAGLLIYTAAGDSEGTMGGLVRMASTGLLELVLHNAIEGSRWCSADPICMELGASGGQGPDSCNNAACHNCALVPETSCELFNRFLDRAMVIGDPEGNVLGFFSNA